MFGSAFVEVGIGLISVYVFLSLLCSGLNELMAQVLGLRTRTLKEGISRLLTDEKTRRQFYQHPLITGLGRVKGAGKAPTSGEVKPSYIPSRSFALALLDVVRSGGEEKEETGEARVPVSAPPASGAIIGVAEVRKTVAKIEQKEMRTALLTLIDASSNLEQAVKNVEAWFDNTMDRASGWYKRRAQLILMALALVVAGGINADTISFSGRLWKDSGLRQSVIAAAGTYVAEGESVERREEALGQLKGEFADMRLPLGWAPGERPCKTGQWVTKVVGLLLTALMVSLGAPFWFDLLNKVARLRTTGGVPEKSTGK